MIWNRNKDKNSNNRRNRRGEGSEPGRVKLYGDQIGDGAVQLSFTLPVPAGDKAKVAAELFCGKMRLRNAKIIHMEAMSENFTFFVAYAQSDVEVDYARIHVPRLEYPQYSFDDINDLLKKRLKRKLVVLGACIGSDAHTVGIDAIFNMKGYLGDYGLERYPMMEAINLRAQVDVDVLVQKIIEKKADAVLVSRVVTQRDEHIVQLKKFLDALAANPDVPKNLIKICGGPRLDHKTAIEIGYDAGFGQGTKPGQVASYLTTEIFKRLRQNSREDRPRQERSRDERPQEEVQKDEVRQEESRQEESTQN